MEKHLVIEPGLGNYIKPYDDLSNERSSDDILETIAFLQQRRRSLWDRYSRRIAVQALVHIILLMANLTVCILYITWASNKWSHGPDLRYSPAQSSVGYETRVFELAHIYLNDDVTLNPNKPTRFNGPPTPALEAAWDDLLQHQNMRLTKTELGEHAGESALVELPDGGYFGTLTVYHSLHCVQRLHHIMYRDHYYPNISEPDFLRLKGHAEHCLDTLRQNIQCGADVTVQAFHWGTTKAIPLGHDDSTHECVDWKRVDGWAKEHSFNPLAPGYLSHPNLGLAYPNGVGDPLGLVHDQRLQEG